MHSNLVKSILCVYCVNIWMLGTYLMDGDKSVFMFFISIFTVKTVAEPEHQINLKQGYIIIITVS